MKFTNDTPRRGKMTGGGRGATSWGDFFGFWNMPSQPKLRSEVISHFQSLSIALQLNIQFKILIIYFTSTNKYPSDIVNFLTLASFPNIFSSANFLIKPDWAVYFQHEENPIVYFSRYWIELVWKRNKPPEKSSAQFCHWK